jgi:anti-anti-sigma factor
VSTIITLKPIGEFNANGVKELRGEVESVLADASTIVIDLSGVKTMNAEGFRALVGLRQICMQEQKQFELINASDFVRNFFMLFGLLFYGSEEYFTIGE